ncbi:uncharacterized protein LOC112202391 [Rosa chinensis]|uniref:uncharacterized protein LOC112202391 n=1 Tax=Rosa chinensis TaxID=74649 RepID=UPI000D08CB2F|nr:uncharacterized protein LOC112202391 [Rosa chinensis]
MELKMEPQKNSCPKRISKPAIEISVHKLGTTGETHRVDAVIEVQAGQVIVVTIASKSRSFILRRRCFQDLREKGLLLLQYRKACCWDLKAQGLHQRRHCDMFIGTLPDMFIGDAAPVRIIGTLPGMFIGDTAQAWIIGTLPGMLVLTSLTPEGAAVRRACNRKEKVVESYGMRS